MKRVLVASALVLGFAGAAFAQQAPVHVGNYGPAVASELTADGAIVVTDHGVDRMTTASIKSVPVHQTNKTQAIWSMYSGR